MERCKSRACRATAEDVRSPTLQLGSLERCRTTAYTCFASAETEVEAKEQRDYNVQVYSKGTKV